MALAASLEQKKQFCNIAQMAIPPIASLSYIACRESVNTHPDTWQELSHALHTMQMGWAYVFTSDWAIQEMGVVDK